MAARKAAEVKEILERVEDSKKDRAYYENAIRQAITEYYFDNYGAETTEEIAKCSQNTFLGACVYANKQCIDKASLMEYVPHNINGETIIHNEAYSAEKVDLLCGVYLNLCFLYEKVPSVFCFAELSGIDRTILQGWINDEKRVTPARRGHTAKRSIEKLRDARAEMLQGVAITGGKGTIGSIAILNNSTWKETEQKREEERPLLACDLPDLRHLLPPEERQALPDFSKENSVHTLD